MNEVVNQDTYSDETPINNNNQLLPIYTSYFDPNIVETISHFTSVMIIAGFYNINKKVITPAILSEPYDIIEDFEWFTSGKIDVSVYGSKYIAIWKKHIVGAGETPLEVERLAKAYCGENCRPSIIYVAESDDSIL